MTYYERLCKGIDILRRARKVRGVTQAKLAKMLKHPDITCNQMLISNIESAADKRVFPEEIIDKFLEVLPLWCDVLDLDYQDMLDLVQGNAVEECDKAEEENPSESADERMFRIMKDSRMLETLVKLLKTRRIERRWSLKQIGSHIGVSYSTMYRMENEANPDKLKYSYVSRYRKWEELLLGDEDPFINKEETLESTSLDKSFCVPADEAKDFKMNTITSSIMFHDILLPNIATSVTITELCYLRGKVNGIESLTEDEFKHYQAWELHLWRQNKKD